MNPLSCIKQILWEPAGLRVRDIHPAVVQVFLFVVLPLSLLPPVMLLFAGYSHPAAFHIDVAFSRWVDVAVAFFAMELLTVPLIAWVIRDLASMLKIENDYPKAFLLAGIAPIPLWLSSVALVVPSLTLLLTVAAVGLIASAMLLHRGIHGVFDIRNEEDAQALSSSAFAVGGLAWAILCGIVVLPLMG